MKNVPREIRESGAAFAFLADPWAEPTPDEAERLLSSLERRWRAIITVHDLVGVLALPDGTSVVRDERMFHRHPTCLIGRPGCDEVERLCIAHCWKAVNARGDGSERAFTHRCWRGQREIVVPVHHEGIHCLTLFVNLSAARRRRGKGELSGDVGGPAARPGSQRLEAGMTLELVADAHLVGRRLIEIAEEVQGLSDSSATEGDDGRQRTLRRLLMFHAHQKVTRGMVAEALGVSPSRASHLVTELFGKPWRELLLDARIERAKRLLRRRTLAVAQIASLCGYADPNAFNRIFHKRTGISPDLWRKS